MHALQLSLIALTALLSLILTAACTQTQFKGEHEGHGIAQIYSASTLPIPAPPVRANDTAGDRWAAIAYADDLAILDDSDLLYLFGIGIANNQATQKDAEQAALQTCEFDEIVGCQLKVSFQAQCFALAFDPQSKVFAWHIAPTVQEAEDGAKGLCHTQTQGNVCKTLTTVCPSLAGTQLELPFSESHPEEAALLAHNLAIFARHVATLRDQGITREEVVSKLQNTNQLSGQQALDDLYSKQINIVYGPFKNFSPYQIYRMQMFSILYDLSR